ncbi:TniQ family protein [Roseateles sp. UC29_93]|uniref:TniQ family protein n=1 Tax=Roseateles sp. UC29_93 TaxID=3350177 RepID=UPI00366F0323
MERANRTQLPVRLQLADGESGLGYALRALRANGIAFHVGMKWLSLTRFHPIDRDAARRIAWALNVDSDQWARRVAMVEPGRAGWVRLAGLRLRRHVASTKLYAKLCPQCVRETGIVRLSWLLRASVGCPHHGYSLIWSCRRCGERIGWDRPDVDICRCGFPFQAVGATALEPNVLAWQLWLEAALNIESVTCSMSDSLPTVFDHLSPDGAFRVLEALGIYEESNSSARQAIASCTTPQQIGATLSRGIARLRAIEASPEDAAPFAALTHQSAIVELAKDHACSADHAIAWWLLAVFRSNGVPSKTRAGLRPKGQLPLFLP